MMPAVDWISWLKDRADRLPDQPHDALWLEKYGVRVGSIEASLAERLVGAGLPLHPSPAGWHVTGPADSSLAALAHWLNSQGLGGCWREELLAVTDEADQPVATIERAAVRPLGVTTHAVHLVGRTPTGGVWVQQRALDKATDPGLWDTTMGGLRTATETVHHTLVRETWEEAGLHLPELHSVLPRGRLTVRRPIDEMGYVVEDIDVFEALAPGGLVPVNQDGEVACFECVDTATLRQWLRQERFTLEAALVLLRCIPALG